ncbi:hypothetical protein RB195_015673 [Necator americanus]|uniref:Uncharacterized protein n=1 Tax=Necator americanus TaxID=51031 RepID=A0ABR1E5X0_NECAM
MSRGSFLVNRPSRMERRKTRGGFAARSEPSKAATTAKAASGSFSRPESFSVPGKASHSSAMSRQSITRRHQRSLTSTEDAQRQWMMTLRPLLSMGLYFNIIIILCLLFFAIAVSMKSKHRTTFYKFREKPNVIRFKEIAVVTTSTQCNELARALIMDEFSTKLIAFAMMICLHVTEVHKTGFGGSSTIVTVDLNASKPCDVLDTFDLFDFPLFEGAKREYKVDRCTFKRLDGLPFHTIAAPGELLTAGALLNGVERKHFLRLKGFLENYQHKTYALSHSISEANRQFSPRLVFSNELDWMFDKNEDYRPLDEGEKYSIPMRLFDLITHENIINNSSPEGIINGTAFISQALYNLEFILREPCTEKSFLFKNYDLFVFPNMKERYSRGRKNFEQPFDDERLCMPAPFGEIISEAEFTSRRTRDEGPITRRILDMFEHIKAVYDKVRSTSTGGDTQQQNVSRTKTKSQEQRTRSDDNGFRTMRSKDIPPEDLGSWHASTFTIVNQKEKQAIVYVGALGSL